MRKFTVKGKTYKLTEEQYERLLERLDVSQAVHSTGDTCMVIRKKCICPSSYSGIMGCPECCLGPKINNCTSIMSHVAGREPSSLFFFRNTVEWGDRSKKAPEFLTKLRNALLELPKV